MAEQFVFTDGHWRDALNNLTDDDAVDWRESWAEEILPICGCYMPAVIVDGMVAYLGRVVTWGEGGDTPPLRHGTPDHLADYLLAELASTVGLTEHGGSIGGSWISDAGRRWLQLAERDGAEA